MQHMRFVDSYALNKNVFTSNMISWISKGGEKGNKGKERGNG